MQKKIFVSGATGFIGSHVALCLADEGHIVHALFRSFQKAEILKHENIRLFQGDVCDKSSLETAMASCEEAYHLGAFARLWDKDPTLCQRVNVEGTSAVLDSAVKCGIKKIVVTSTAGVLGPSNSKPIGEECERTSNFFNAYELSKFEMEKKVLEYGEKGLLVVIVNPTRVFGPGLLSEANSATKIIKAYIHGKWHIIPGSGNSIGNYAFIDDVVKGHILAMEKGLSGERYILGGANLSFLDFFSVISAVSGKRYRMIRVPAQSLICISGLVFFFSRLFGKPPRLAPQWIKRYFQNWAVSSKKAESELGYKITPIEEGIGKTVQWLRDRDSIRVLETPPLP
ncbi:MAG: SDR family oxidoreductase [Candidatus Aminicenantes bacterium]|nr:SDR family oxidoreductase [Candidatus Aminicenantes bacterium]